MQFLYPNFLWALLALAIPIIIHLFYFRRFKKVYFTNVRFLKEIKEETSARRKLRNLLVLAMRMLAIAFLIFAFAQPFIPQATAVKKGAKAVSVFVDNSFSMNALSEDVPLVEKAKQRAREIIMAYGVEDRFQILTNDFEGRHQRLLNQEDALTLVDEIKASPAVRPLSTVLTRQQQALNSGQVDHQVAYLLSDFQQNITQLDEFRDTSLEVNLIPLQAIQERNISIDSCWFVAPVQMLNQSNTLMVRVRNHSRELAENVRLTLRHKGQVKPVGTLSIPAGASVVDTINITVKETGWHKAELQITDYPVQFDDRYYFSFYVDEQIRMLVINQSEKDKYLSAAFNGVEYFQMDNQLSNKLDYSSFPTYQLIIMNGLSDISSGLSSELTQYVGNGGNLLVFPAYNANITAYKQFLNSFKANELQGFEAEVREVSRINMEEFVFNNVFDNGKANLKLPVTQGNFKLTTYNNRGEERLLTYRDGSTFLGKYQREQGHLYLCAAPLAEQYSDLSRNGEIFIPMLYKMAIATAKGRKIAYTIGQDNYIETKHYATSGELVYKLQGAQEEFIPQQQIIGYKAILGLEQQLSNDGFYQLFLEADKPLAQFGFNYDRKESNMKVYDRGELETQVGNRMNVIDASVVSDLSPLITEQSRGIILWRWCLILALLFLALEVLLLRFWRA